MDIEEIRLFCNNLPAVSEDVKWGNDLCFSVGYKMFAIAGLSNPVSICFKVSDDEFDELSSFAGFKPAPYLARYKWILLENASQINSRELQKYIKQSYELIKSKLPKKTLKEIRLI